MSKKIDIQSFRYREAIRLKYENESYAVIAKKLKVSVYTVEGWFAFGGLLKEEYEKYSKEKTEMLGLLCDETLAKNVHIAGNMLVALMGSADDNVKFRAVTEIITRVRGAPKTNADPQGLLGTDLSYEQILRKARERPP
jgi:hypothetical protein